MSPIIDRIKKELIQAGIQPTYQRIQIVKYLMENRNHPTADSIYRDMSAELPTLSRATVYNTVNLLVEKNLLGELNITGTETHYDYYFRDHQHFLCIRCGRIYDISVDCSLMQKKVPEIDGHRVDEIYGYMKGLCVHCRKRENQ